MNAILSSLDFQRHLVKYGTNRVLDVYRLGDDGLEVLHERVGIGKTLNLGKQMSREDYECQV